MPVVPALRIPKQVFDGYYRSLHLIDYVSVVVYFIGSDVFLALDAVSSND